MKNYYYLVLTVSGEDRYYMMSETQLNEYLNDKIDNCWDNHLRIDYLDLSGKPTNTNIQLSRIEEYRGIYSSNIRDVEGCSYIRTQESGYWIKLDINGYNGIKVQIINGQSVEVNQDYYEDEEDRLSTEETKRLKTQEEDRLRNENIMKMVRDTQRSAELKSEFDKKDHEAMMTVALKKLEKHRKKNHDRS